MVPGQPDVMPAITAVLGPTNTGKTHRAIERMLEHDSGMMGLPLRLLAREVYDRVTRVVGERAVALVTGEEKRIGAQARYWICTVEAMPLSRAVDFLAIDEIQLSAHPQRGHVFTERLLHARGLRETWFLGSDTMRPLLEELLPGARITRRPRFSRLSNQGSHSLGTLPKRSAVVAFSMNRVYELAERIRLRRGGAAVVLGALSPRARNAQVALYQSGEVDYMVATDAIGMGLNLDIGHVAFADQRKFDGREARELDVTELAQIAGRAGRHLNDGTFGTLRPLAPFPDKLARRIERHQFPPEQRLIWRNAELDLRSVPALLASLRAPPPSPHFKLVDDAEDTRALQELLTTRPEIAARAEGPEAVALLWEICQIPDYRQLLVTQHVALLCELFTQLSSARGKLDPDWLRERVDRLDDTEADIDTLLARMAFVRTWTYVAHHTEWLDDASHWQARTRSIEDRLSDALHQQLVLRFVDRSRSLHQAPGSGGVSPSGKTQHQPATAFQRLLELKRELEQRDAPPAPDETWFERLADAEHAAFRLDAQGRCLAGEHCVGQLTRGRDLLHPDVQVTAPEGVHRGTRSRVQRRLLAWTRDLIQNLNGSSDPQALAALSPAARGVLYQLEQHLGTTLHSAAEAQLTELTEADRELLAAAGIQLGERVIYSATGLKPEALIQRQALVRAYYPAPLPPLRAGAVSFRRPERIPSAALMALGYPVFGPRAIRADVVERVDRALRRDDPPGPARVATWLGCSSREISKVVAALGHLESLRGLSRRRLA